MFLQYLVICVVAYLLGSINFATIIARFNKKDITTLGSGNPGTMNMVRSMGAKWGALTFVLDILKAALPALIGLLWIGNATGMYAGGVSAVFGHIYPIFNKFKGGKGVASAMGVFFVAAPIWSLISFVALLIFLFLFKYGSVGNLIFVTVLTIEEGVRFTGEIYISLLLFGLWILVWFSHRANIFHIVAGNERKSHLLRAFKKIDTTEKSSKNITE